MSDLPNSLDEKNSYNDPRLNREHWLYVHELQAILATLKPDDWLTPNMVANLNVGRGENNCWATIDFGWNRLEVWEQTLEPEEEEPNEIHYRDG